MLKESRRPGRPKSKKAPDSKATLYKRAMTKNKEEGGVRLNSLLRGEDVKALERFRKTYGFPSNMSYAMLLKIMLVMVDGNAFQRTGYLLTVKVKRQPKWIRLTKTK